MTLFRSLFSHSAVNIACHILKRSELPIVAFESLFRELLDLTVSSYGLILWNRTLTKMTCSCLSLNVITWVHEVVRVHVRGLREFGWWVEVSYRSYFTDLALQVAIVRKQIELITTMVWHLVSIHDLLMYVLKCPVLLSTFLQNLNQSDV